jgi:ABC-2 type transport system permease protein
MSFQNIFTIWKKELKSYFYGPMAYVFIGAFTIIMSIMFWIFLYAYWQYTMSNPRGMPQEITIDRLSESFYGNMHMILLFVLPFLTMFLFTEEVRKNTFVLLMTSPIKHWELTIAKYASALSMLFFMLVLTLVFPLFLTLYSADGPVNGPDPGIVLTTYLGLFMCGAVYLGVGTLWSSVVNSPMVAVMLTFASCFGLWMISISAQNMEGAFTPLLKHVSIMDHFNGMLQGSLDIKSLVFFGSVIFFTLFLTNRSLESRAWRS